MSVRAVLDGVTIAPPQPRRVALATSAAVAGSHEFMFKQVTPGSHTLRMQFNSSFNGKAATVGHRTTIVLHAP
jgi:hypothetical protein